METVIALSKTHVFLLVGIYLVLTILIAFLLKFIRRLVKYTKFTFDDYVIKILTYPAVFTVLFVGIIHISHYIFFLKNYLFLISAFSKSIIVILWSVAGFRIIKELTKKKFFFKQETGHLEADIVLLIKNISYAVLAIITITVLLKTWKIDLSPILASAGIAGIALALAAKETLANFFGGISIFLDRTYKVGDYIILDSGERGEVIDVGIRSTRIKTRDDVIITIPNSIMANSKIINESAPEPRFRLRLPIGVSYSSDLEKVEEVLLEVVNKVEHIVKNPPPLVRYREFGESSINLELLCWVDDPRNRGPVTHNLIKEILNRFREEDIVIPFPQRDVHIYPVKERR